MKKILLLILLFPLSSFANPSPSKKNYNLFHETPKNLMREIAVDRPSKSDAAKTLDAGHFMVESSFFDYTRERKNDDLGLASSLTLKAGLTQNQELQAIFDLYKYQRIKSQNSLDEKDGFGDLTLRLKHNFFGNDGGNYVLTVIPFLRIATAQNGVSSSNDHNEFGVAVPFEIAFDEDSLTVQGNFSRLNDGQEIGLNSSFVSTYAFALNEKFSSYVELYFAKTNLAQSKWQNSLDFGLSYSCSENLVVDAAMNLGISEYADDVNLLSGVAYRF